MPEASGAVQKVAVRTPEDVWIGVRDSLRAKLSHETFDTWFSLIEFHGIDHAQRIISLLAPNEIVRSWVTTSFSSLLEQTLVELSLPGYSIGWITEAQVAAASIAPSHEAKNVDSPSDPSKAKAQAHVPPPLVGTRESKSFRESDRQMRSRSIHRSTPSTVMKASL